MRIDLNNLKMMISISMTKTSEPFAAVKGDKVEKWKKVMENDKKL